MPSQMMLSDSTVAFNHRSRSSIGKITEDAANTDMMMRDRSIRLNPHLRLDFMCAYGGRHKLLTLFSVTHFKHDFMYKSFTCIYTRI